MRLNDTFIKNSTKHTGRASGDKHTDGGGLYLHVNGAGKYWRMNYRFAAKQKTLSLGVYPALSLANARKGREKAREMLSQGMDPSTEKQDAKQAQKMAMVSTFEAVAREFHGIKASSWSESHAGKWLRMNELYLFPMIGKVPIQTLKAKHVLEALRKVEAKGILSTAQDLKQMAGQVFRYAVQTSRIEHNPVPDLKGALKSHVTKNYSAIVDPVDVGGLLRAIDGYTGQQTTVAALKLSALFFQRPGNIRAMEWAWVDFDQAILKVPPADMKRSITQKVNGKPHLIPIARQAIEILAELQALTGGGRYVFPGARSLTRPMSGNTLNAALRRLDYGTDDHVAHGFRAMAKTMLLERIHGIDPEIVEAQLAHGKSGPLGSAYDRAEYMDQRRAMMQTWADYLDKLRIGAEVIPICGTS